MSVLLIYKENPQDPCLQAMKRWIIKLDKKAYYFRFRHSERGRFESLNINIRLEKVITNKDIKCVIDWTGLCNIEEINLIKSKGIIFFIHLNGFTSFNSGHTTDQNKFFEQLRLSDFYMVPEKNHVSILRNYNINAIHSNFFADPTIYRPLNPPFRNDFFDFFFVGAVNKHWANNRREFLSFLSQKNKVMIVAGSEAEIKNATCLPQITVESIVNLLQNQSKIVCGSDYLPSVEPYNSRIKNTFIKYDLKYTIRARTFTVLASSRPYLVESHDDIEALFEKGKEILTWKDNDELVDIIDRSLIDKKYLTDIGIAGYNTFISKYTVFHKLAEFEILSGLKLFPELQNHIKWIIQKCQK